MSKFEADTIATLTALFEKVNELKEIHIRDLLQPGKYGEYKAALDAAYDSLVTVEDALDSLGMKLEYEHWRISSAFEELTPIFIQTRSRSDMTIEAMQQDLERKRTPLQ